MMSSVSTISVEYGCRTNNTERNDDWLWVLGGAWTAVSCRHAGMAPLSHNYD